MTHRLCFTNFQRERGEDRKYVCCSRTKKIRASPKTPAGVACEQQTYFRFFRRERSDDRKCVCCSQASISSGREEIRAPLETPVGRLCFHGGRFAAERNIFSKCLLTYWRLLAVFTFKFSSEELRGFKFKKRAKFKNVRRRSALNVFSFNDSRYFMNAVE